MKTNNKKEKAALILLGATIITNPLTGSWVMVGIEWVFTQLFIYGAWVTLATATYLIGLIFYYLYASRGQVNTAPKAKKAPKVAYLET